MKINYHDLSTYEVNHEFYADFSLLITIKSFDLQAIRERYLKTRGKKSNRTGSVERRKVSTGGIAYLEMAQGKIQKETILARMPEPRGIHNSDNRIALSSENRAYVIYDNKIFTVTDPWFSYIHTVQLHPNHKNRLLISSSGFDSIFEYDFLDNRRTFEWFAWENGFMHGKDPETGEKVFLTKNPEQAKKWKSNGTKHILITDPENETLPTARRAAFINSVVYHTRNNNLLGTFFHEGAVYCIDRTTGKAEKVLDELKNPHGGQTLHNQYMGTSTGSGEVVTGGISNQNRYNFKSLPGKPGFLKDMEWIQNSIVMGDNILSIDSNRNAFVIFNPEKKLIDFIPYNNNWAVQDMATGQITDSQVSLINKLII